MYLEKHAAKKRLSKALALALYGEKPVAGKAFRRLGTGLGALAGAERGFWKSPLVYGSGSLSRKIERGLNRLGIEGEDGVIGTNAALLTLSSLGGGALGSLGGRAAGKQLDELLIKKQMAKYLKRKKLVNAGLMAGGGAGLAGLLLKNK